MIVAKPPSARAADRSSQSPLAFDAQQKKILTLKLLQTSYVT
jgi:hypothetical protein